MYNQVREAVGLSLMVCVCAAPMRADAQSKRVKVSFHTALERAQTQSPDVMVSRAGLDVARAHIASQEVWRANPSLTTQAGPRLGQSGTPVDFWIDARQPIFLGARRAGRVAVARQEHRTAQDRVARVRQLARWRAGKAYAELVYQREQVALGQQNLQRLQELQSIAQARAQAGDGGGLEVSRATLSVQRVMAQMGRREAQERGAQEKLVVLLGMEPGSRLDTSSSLSELARTPLPGASSRADVQEARSSLQVQRERVALARALALPDFTLGLRVGSEDGAALVRAVFGVTVPLFDRGQGEEMEARAHVVRAKAVLDARVRHARAEQDAARVRVTRMDAAVKAFEERGLATLQETERRARESWTSGDTSLGELLLIRGELMMAREEYNTLLYEAALARIDLRASQGGL